MKSLLVLSLSLLSTAAFADTVCSNAAGNVRYRHTGYNRGIPPRQGDVLGTIQITVDGVVVSRSVAYEGRKPDLGPVNPDFSAIQVLKQEQYSKDFSALLTLSKNPTNPSASDTVHGLSLPLLTFVVCHEVNYPVP